ncbi:MAG: hypothetical protein FWG29_10155 [Treponema sp.]|nr:hypothetical protein [Treponema sp.]
MKAAPPTRQPNNKGKRFLVVLFIVLSAVSAHAQTAEQPVYSAEGTEAGVANEDSRSASPDFFIAPLAEIVGYSRIGPSFGAGFALGAGNGVAIGARFLYCADTESVYTMEITVFMRFYIQGADVCTGPFAQLNAGASIFNHEHSVSPPTEVGALSAGVAAGWRFLLAERWYVEPALRFGYPYMFGVGVAFAYRLK